MSEVITCLLCYAFGFGICLLLIWWAAHIGLLDERGEGMIGADTILEVTRNLIGETEPYGDSCIDEKRAENLEKLLFVVTELLYDVEKVANNRDRQEGTMRKMGEQAYTVLSDWWEYTSDYLQGEYDER